MRLKTVRLSNWKGYRKAALELPDTTTSRNVLVIRGANGAGKTSLLEAIVLGLFGRQGLGLVGRALAGERADASYDGFLERALNTGAKGREARISVELEFSGGELEAFSLKRTWHFTAGGRHKRDDEEVTILRGPEWDLEPLPPPPERDEAVRDLVGRSLVPRNLAPFFIFDGEDLDRIAGKNLEAQMRAAAELVLGASELRTTIADLRSYGRERRRSGRISDNGDLEKLRAEAADLEAEEQVLLRRVEDSVSKVTPVRASRDEIVRRIGNLHGDSYASFKELFEAREASVRERASEQEKLRQALSVDLALALCGVNLRANAQQQMAAEALLDRWEAGQANSASRFGDFTDALSAAGPLDNDMKTRLRAAWDKVWFEPPTGCATERRHSHLGEADRHLVSQHLEAVSVSAGNVIADLARRVEVLDLKIEELEDRIARQRGLDEQSQSLADELKSVQESIARLEAQHSIDVQDLDQLRLRLSPLRQEIGRLTGHAASSAPVLHRANVADEYAAAMERAIEAALPRSTELLAQDVTNAYRAMAHKDVVQQVRIGADGTVALLDGAGRDVRSQDPSAGELQIFALSLMAAIAAAHPVFPVVMDTPFARLDIEHRRNVLRHFSSLGTQLILLAHPAELSPNDIEALGENFAGEVEVHHELAEGESLSRLSRPKEPIHGA